MHDQLLLILLLIDVILVSHIGWTNTSRRNRIHSRSRKAFLGHRLRIFWSLILTIIELAGLIHVKVLVRVLALIVITRVKLRGRNWLSLILKSIQDVAWIGQERLVHGVRKVAAPVIWRISLGVVYLLTCSETSWSWWILLRVNLWINHILHVLKVHLLHELLLVVKTTSGLMGLRRQSIKSLHLVLSGTWCKTRNALLFLFLFLPLVHLNLGRIGRFFLEATGLVGARVLLVIVRSWIQDQVALAGVAIWNDSLNLGSSAASLSEGTSFVLLIPIVINGLGRLHHVLDLYWRTLLRVILVEIEQFVLYASGSLFFSADRVLIQNILITLELLLAKPTLILHLKAI